MASEDRQVLDHLQRIGPLYERYVELARLAQLATLQESAAEATQYEPPAPADQPLGLVLDPAQFEAPPIGLRLGSER